MMFIQSWGGVFSESLLNLWYGFMSFVPSLLLAIILFIIGWIIGSVVGKAIAQVIDALKINKLFESAGAGDLMNRAGLKLNVGGFVGWIVKWFIITAFLMTSLEFLGLTQVSDFLRETVILYLPKVIVATLVLAIAVAISDVMQKVVQATAQAANARGAKMVGSIVKYAIWTFAFIIAFSELGIATAFMQTLFIGIVAALAISFGLAFGLGGKDAASRAIERVSHDMSTKM